MYLFVMIAVISCSPGREQDATRVEDYDTISADKKTNAKANTDTLSMLTRYFKVKNTSIPISLVKNYLGVDNAEERYSACYSDEMTARDDLTLFILRLNCTAGGICKEKVLVVFDAVGFKSQLTVEQEMSDESFLWKVDYEFLSNTFVQLKKVAKEFNEHGDTVKDSTYLEYYSINKEGLIEKSIGLTH